ncbi:hypothetical protein BO83DRAFT_9538 [Aspergillus eucalypticola CBS 122712]|uniref:Uncharacterized protein n=1 Tax=Aspergillus eucalypticola (strain CBS 122712 / IBT 29274) TaxID=1448314 RepID=A0A317WGC0_ASPEC|nr:uncharacterized protein BO83DRAFT_9538 [Aspergillus eucalypticola CBS 122712]PWY85516.1 hypothetical protein BO83DRAFT_9538 [Aspergillus eucalypticola CBS 122712]
MRITRWRQQIGDAAITRSMTKCIYALTCITSRPVNHNRNEMTGPACTRYTIILSTLSVIEVKGLLFIRSELPSQALCTCEADSEARAYVELYYLVDEYVPFGEGTGPRKTGKSERVSLSDERDYTRA